MAAQDLDEYRKAQAEREQQEAAKREQLGATRTHGNGQAGSR